MSTPAGYALALILFFGRGWGRGGRATAKPTVSRRSSADGFAVKMKQTKAGGQDCQILFPVFGGEMATAKIQTVKGEGWRFFAKQKILLGLDGLDSRNGNKLLFLMGYGIVFPV